MGAQRLFNSLTRVYYPTPAALQAAAAEFFGTFIFLFVGMATVTSGCHLPESLPASDDVEDLSLSKAVRGSCSLQINSTLAIAFAFGFGIFVAIYCTAAISGGHLNPAMTFIAFLGGRVSIVRAMLYISCQLSAGMLAALAVKGLDPHGFTAAAGAANAVNAGRGMTSLSTWGLETILTFALAFTVCAATDTLRGSDAAYLPVLSPLAIAMLVFVAHIVAIPLDGCSLNPARSFGPAVVADSWKAHWIFWAGPFCGAIMAFLVVELVFRQQTVTGSDVDSDEATEIPVSLPEGSQKGSCTSRSAETIPVGEVGYNGSDEPYQGSVLSIKLPASPRCNRTRSSRSSSEARLAPSNMPAAETSKSGGNTYLRWPELTTSIQEIEA